MFSVNSADQKNEEITMMIAFISSLLAVGKILLSFSVLIFVDALIASFGDQLKIGRR
jgi:hypothetical protein